MRAKYPAFCLALGFCAFLFAQPAGAEAVIGQPAPAFVATTLDGKTVDVAALKGKVVILHFWATWCAPCREEMPALEVVWRHYHGQGLEVLAVSADRPRARDAVDQVMRYFSFPAAMMGAITKNDFLTLNSVPVTYVVGKGGTVEAILTPDIAPLTEQGLGVEIKALLDAKTESKPDVKS